MPSTNESEAEDNNNNNNVVCSKCDLEISGKQFVRCSVKNCALHFSCAGIRESSWKHKNKSQWKCEECRKPQETVSSEEMRDFMSFVRGQLLDLSPLKQVVTDLEKSVTYFSECYDSLNKDIQNTQHTVKGLKSEVEELSETLAAKDRQISYLNDRLMQSEQYLRNRNLEISGVVVHESENLISIMEKLAQMLDVPFKPEDIDIIHRVPTRKPGRTPKIIAQFTTRKARDPWLRNKKHGILSKDLVPSSKNSDPVYIGEHLTSEWQQLLWQCKQEGKKTGHKVIWFRDGKIFAKKSVADRDVIRITTIHDINLLAGH